MPDFWKHSGYHLTTRDHLGALQVSDDFLRAYFARPEVAPVAESCDAERALFEFLMSDPRGAVSDDTILSLNDPDARENYRVILNFRDHLTAFGSLEAGYARLFVDAQGRPRDFATVGVPPLFADQLTHVILRGLLDDCDDALMARAAELFFREQRASVEAGQILLADMETVEMRAATSREGAQYGNLGRLIAQVQSPLRTISLDVLDRTNADIYWSRDERHDTAIQLNHGRPALDALCRVIERWVGHFFSTRVTVAPVHRIEGARMRWFTGLDRESSALLNKIYNGVEPGADVAGRLLCLMELRFEDERSVIESARGLPVMLALAMNERREVRLKPQNLLINLPLRRAE